MFSRNSTIGGEIVSNNRLFFGNSFRSTKRNEKINIQACYGYEYCYFTEVTVANGLSNVMFLNI